MQKAKTGKQKAKTGKEKKQCNHGKKQCPCTLHQPDHEEAWGRFKMPKEEKKARRILSTLNMAHMPGFTKIVMRRTDNTLITIDAPEVYKPPNSDTYIFFGVPHCQEPLEHAQEAAAQKFKIEDFLQQAMQSDETSSISSGNTDDESESAEGLNDNDIDTVITQCEVSRKKAIRALKKHNNDLVNAIMALTI